MGLRISPVRASSLPTAVVVFALFFCVYRAAAGYSVHFDRDVYRVFSFETLMAQLLFDYDDTAPGDQPPPLGLFSMGVEILFPEALARVADEDAIVIPDPLNGDGAGGPPPKRVGTGSAGASGALDLFASEGYLEPLITTFTLETLDDAAVFTIQADFFFRDTRANFVDFEGNLLDPGVTFGSATVQIIPEPVATVLLAAGFCFLAPRRRRA